MIGASVSGMLVARTTLDVTANDIANVSTSGFRPSSGQEPPAGLSGTDLTEEMPELIVAGAAYGANAAALRAQDETTGFLLDVLAR